MLFSYEPKPVQLSCTAFHKSVGLASHLASEGSHRGLSKVTFVLWHWGCVVDASVLESLINLLYASLGNDAWFSHGISALLDIERSQFSPQFSPQQSLIFFKKID